MLSGTKVCFLTTGQPSTNPRLVKEADALVEQGCKVHVIYTHWADWATRTDRELLSSRSWTHSRVGGSPDRERLRYWGSRLRHSLGRRALSRGFSGRFVEKRALSRTSPELEAAGKASTADLYIAHNLGALPAAVAAARKQGALAGFDAEDFHSGMNPGERTTPEDKLATAVEARLLRSCAYVTAASPGIGEAYAQNTAYCGRKPFSTYFHFRSARARSDWQTCAPLLSCTGSRRRSGAAGG